MFAKCQLLQSYCWPKVLFLEPWIIIKVPLSAIFSLAFFLDEAHGFKKAENKKKALDGEFYFYSKILGFEAADKDIEVSFT